MDTIDILWLVCYDFWENKVLIVSNVKENQRIRAKNIFFVTTLRSPDSFQLIILYDFIIQFLHILVTHLHFSYFFFLI